MTSIDPENVLLAPAHKGGRGAPHVPPIKIFEKLPHKNAIKHDPPDFLTTPSTPFKRVCQKNPRTPPPLDFQLLCIYAVDPKTLYDT